MDTRRQSRRRLAPAFSTLFLVLLLLLQTTAVRAAFTNNFDAYPSGTRSCLNASANASGCDGDDVTSMNDCLCGNTGNFVISAAECIGKADYADLETVYTTMASACSFSNTPLSVSQKDFLSAGNGTFSSSTTSMPSTTSGASSTPSLTTITTTSNGHVETITETAGSPKNTGGSSSDNNNSGMSSTTRTGIIAGATVAGVAIVAVFAFFLIRMWRNRQPTEEHRPMLGGDGTVSETGVAGGRGGGPGSQVSGTELSHLSGANTYDWKAGAGGGDPSENKWPHDPYNSSPSPNLLYQQQSGGVYELPVQDGAQHPVEMPATPMVMGATPVHHHPQGQPTEYGQGYR
ncbi:hypothetical protein Sste5346_006034 [Sporothrix stenoceras]|uniref:Extracellular membrane protein CFEM domain-containing protein n=1 Tax=Sporothrix stenoceras TaxID=5173 RepID=A0ABR3Z0V8_9PEZI